MWWAGYRETSTVLRGEINGLRGEINRIWEAIAGLRQEVADLRSQIADLREQVAENRGLLRALHERVDLVMRHRHDEQTGRVILTPARAGARPGRRLGARAQPGNRPGGRRVTVQVCKELPLRAQRGNLVRAEGLFGRWFWREDEIATAQAPRNDNNPNVNSYGGGAMLAPGDDWE